MNSFEKQWDDIMSETKTADLESKLTALTAVQDLVATNKCSYEVAFQQYKEVLEIQLKARKGEQYEADAKADNKTESELF